MNYIVFDLEFNQDFDSIQISLEDGLKPPFEIIQIGAIKLDSSLNIIGRFNRYIKPIIYLNIRPFITELTGITNDDLILEESFSSVYKDLLDFIGSEEVIFCTWGPSDIKELYNNVIFHKLDFKPLSKKFINVQAHASKVLGLKDKSFSNLKFAVETLDIEMSYDFHNALNDAYYTSEVFKKIYITPIKPSIYDPFYIKNRVKKEKVVIDYYGLLKQFSKMYERCLTKEEEEMIKLAYKMGRTHQFLSNINLPK